jgi:hypothetical protein
VGTQGAGPHITGMPPGRVRSRPVLLTEDAMANDDPLTIADVVAAALTLAICGAVIGMSLAALYL